MTEVELRAWMTDECEDYLPTEVAEAVRRLLTENGRLMARLAAARAACEAVVEQLSPSDVMDIVIRKGSIVHSIELCKAVIAASPAGGGA